MFLFLVGLAVNTIAQPHPPGLDEVLSGSRASWDLNFVFLGLFALSLTTLTLAKSYEIISRKRGELPVNSNKEEILTEENSRLISFNRGLQQENENLKRIRKQLEESLAERMGNEDVLKRELAKLLSPAAVSHPKALKKKAKPAAKKRKKR
ncbi:MAG: hypothetical protein WC645_00630 [Candidatus Margulisiibacteriota bacterium]